MTRLFAFDSTTVGTYRLVPCGGFPNGFVFPRIVPLALQYKFGVAMLLICIECHISCTIVYYLPFSSLQRAASLSFSQIEAATPERNC